MSWNRHVGHFETELSAASGTFYKLRKYLPSKILMSVYYSTVYAHLQYITISRNNSNKIIKRKLQVRQFDYIIEVLCNLSNKKTRLQPLCDKFQVLNIDRIYKLEVSEFKKKFTKMICQFSSIITLLTFVLYPQSVCNQQEVIVLINSLCKNKMCLNKPIPKGIRNKNLEESVNDIKNKATNVSKYILSKLLKNIFRIKMQNFFNLNYAK